MALRHKGILKSKSYKDNGDGTYTCTETYECKLTAVQMEELRTQYKNQKTAAQNYDANVTVSNADSELNKINSAKPE